jgi:hypothetical protein
LSQIDYEVTYETEHPGDVPERAGPRIRVLEATIEFAQLVESASFVRHVVIAQFEHDAESAFGPEQPLDDIAPARSIIAKRVAKRDDHSSAGFERLASEVILISHFRVTGEMSPSAALALVTDVVCGVTGGLG